MNEVKTSRTSLKTNIVRLASAIFVYVYDMMEMDGNLDR